MLKPIAKSESMKTSNAIITKNREQKRMYQELTKELSALNKDETTYINSDITKQLNDAFAGSTTGRKPRLERDSKPTEIIE